jgi:hypothetical protein
MKRAVILAALIVPIASPVFAHHSFATFDTSKNVTITGTVKELQWTNPHIFVQVLVPDASGRAEEWSLESVSVGTARRLGWTPTIIKTGDKVTVYLHPLRDDSKGKGGSLTAIVLPSGQVLGQIPQ